MIHMEIIKMNRNEIGKVFVNNQLITPLIDNNIKYNKNTINWKFYLFVIFFIMLFILLG